MNSIKKYGLIFFAIISLFSSAFLTPASVLAASCDGFDPTGNDPYGISCGANSGLNAGDPRAIIARIINVALGMLGILFVVLIVYAGFMYMTAGGNEENTKKAQKIILYAVIGLAIILSAYAISQFVLNELRNATKIS